MSIRIRQAFSNLFQLQIVWATRNGVRYMQQACLTSLQHETVRTRRNGVHLHITSLFHFVSARNSGNHAQWCRSTCHKLSALCFSSKLCEPRVTVSIVTEQAISTWLPRLAVCIRVQQVTFTWFHPQPLGTSCNSVHSHAASLFQSFSAPNCANYT